VLATATSAQADDVFGKRWGPWVEVGAQAGNSRSLGEANLFAPLYQNRNTLLFADIRGMFDSKKAAEGNFGLGVRHMLPSGWNIGAYGYYDVRRSSFGNTFQQVTLGAEALGEVFDLRANAYLPVGTAERQMTVSSSTVTGSRVVESGGTLVVQTGSQTTTSLVTEKALAGIDGEVGFRLPVFERNSGLDMRAFVGGYYFAGSGVGKVAGPRARLELSASDIPGLPGVKLTGGVTYQNDNVRGDQWIASARLRIPLGATATNPAEPLSYMERRMTDAVVRDVDIVSNTGSVTTTTQAFIASSEETAINTLNGEAVTSIVHIDRDAYASDAVAAAALQAALPNSMENGRIVVLSGDLTAPAGIIVNDGQTLLGGGTALKLRGATTNIELDYVAGGPAGSITGTGSVAHGWTLETLVAIRSRSVLGGLTLVHSGNLQTPSAAVQAYMAPNAVAFNNTVRVEGDNFNNHGIVFRGSSNGLVDGNNIEVGNQQNSAGIYASTSSGIVLRDNDISVMNLSSWMIYSEVNDPVTISGNTFNAHGNGTIIYMSSSSIDPGSTGNTIVGGYSVRCGTSFMASSGTVSFTDGNNCTYP